MLAAIIFVATSGCTWAQLSPVFGPSGPTAHRRFTEETPARIWAKPHRLVLDELGARGGKGSKIHVITDRTGLPLSVAISGANTHDSQAFQPLARGIPPIRSRRGPRRRRPAKLHGDKSYDYDHLRRWLREGGIVHRLAARAWGPPSGWGDTGDRSSAPWDAAAYTAATSARPTTSWPSPASPAR